MEALRKALFVLASVLVVVRAASLPEKPAFLTTCYKKDPQFDDCIAKQLEAYLQRLHHGFPEIGLPSLDPLDVTEISLVSGANRPVNGNATLTDIKVHGLSKSKVIMSRLDMLEFAMESRIHVPSLHIDGKYELNGRLLAIPLSGHGDVTLDPENVDVFSRHDFSLVQREGRPFFHIEKMRLNFTMTGLKMHFTNLFNGQKTLEESTNQYLNENWQGIVDSLQPVLEEAVQDLLKSILDRLLDKLPAEYFVGDL